jgi:outer membrane protein, adhesin transport system
LSTKIDMRCLGAFFWGLCFLSCTVQSKEQSTLAAEPHRALLADLLTRHPGVLAAMGQLKSAQHDTEGAKWQFLPTASVGIEKNPQATNALTDSRTSFVRLQQPLWTGGRLTAQLDKARAQEVLAKLTVSEQHLSLATRWLQLWAEVQAAELKSQALKESEAQHLKYVRQVENRAKEGHAPRSDVQLSLSRLAGVQAELEQSKAQREQALSRLEQMYGGPLPSQAVRWMPLPPSSKRSDEPHRSRDQWITLSLDIHPSLQKSIATVNALRADADIAKSRVYPEVYLRGEVINRDLNRNVQQVYVGLTSNFGAGLSSLASVASAQARLQAQEQDIEVKRRDITDQINADLQTVAFQTQRLNFLVQAHESAEQFMQASERQFDAGRRTWQELMNTAREKSQVLVQMADTQSSRWLAQQRLALLAAGVEVYVQTNANP